MADEPEPSGLDDLGLDDLGLDDLERWAAEARAREAAEARARERWLRTQAEEDARMMGVLAGMAERRVTVTAATTAGRQLVGRVTRVGQDFVAIETGTGRLTLVAPAALAWCRTSREDRRGLDPAVGPESGVTGSEGAGAATLADVLAQAAARRPRLLVHAGATSLSGELRAVGVDVIVLQTVDEPRNLVYVRLPSVSEISFLDSG